MLTSKQRSNLKSIAANLDLSLIHICTQKDSLTNVFDSVTLQEEMAKYKSGDTVYLRFTAETVENEEELAAAQSTVISVQLSQYVESLSLIHI